MSVFCIIPARGGSKGVPQKNIRPFLGRPLIEHSIKYARSAQLVDKVFVSTDDEQIAQVSIKAGADIIDRPANISGDGASTESAITHAMQVWKKEKISPDVVVLLQATSPLRPAGSLDEALEHFKRERFDSLLSISPTHRFFWQIKGNQAQAMYDYMNRPRRQDMAEAEKHYIENGSLYIFTSAHFEKMANRLGGKIGYTIFPEDYSLEIDSLTDFKLLEDLAERIKR